MTNIADMYIVDRAISVLTRDNTLHHINNTIQVDALDTLNFEKPIKILRFSGNLFVVLFEDGSVYACNILTKTKIEKIIPTGKVIIAIHMTDRYILYLFNDMQLGAEGAFNENSTKQYRITRKDIHQSTSDYCISISVEGEGDDMRVYLAFNPKIAPYKVCVSPLLKNKPELVVKAREVFSTLKQEFGNIVWDDNGNIGKRYRRQDEIGTPFCVVVDFDSLEDNSITVRFRDTGAQERIKIDELVSYFHQKLS